MKIEELDLLTQKKTSKNLSEKDWKFSGGEKKIYLKDTRAYGIYHNPQNCIPLDKIKELYLLNHPGIVKPLGILYDVDGLQIGESMNAVKDAYILCELFTKSFKERNKCSLQDQLHVLRCIQDIMNHAHSHDIYIHDGNEMNWLVSYTYKDVYAIDVGNWQTPLHPSSFVSIMVKDYLNPVVGKASDYYNLAILVCQLLIGKHPYEGSHPDFEKYDKVSKVKHSDGTEVVTRPRMEAMARAKVSIFNPKTRIPVAACYPLDIIPPGLKAWLIQVLEGGERPSPPTNYELLIKTPVMNKSVS